MAEASRPMSAEHHAAVPLWRDIRVLRWLFQIIILVLVVTGIVILARNLVNNLNAVGLNLSFSFLSRPAGFAISEGPAFDSRSTILQAYLVGVANSLRVIGIGIVLATILGIIVGVARLSNNWLTSRVALIYIEILQNTPLLLQLFFWFVLVRALPRQRRDEIVSIPGSDIRLGPLDIPPLAYFSQRGSAITGLERHESFPAWWPFLVVGLVVAVAIWLFWVRRKESQGKPPTGQFWLALGGFFIVAVVGWLIQPVSPLRVTIPTLEIHGVLVWRG